MLHREQKQEPPKVKEEIKFSNNGDDGGPPKLF
jgi:hypothetical protein